MSQIITGWQGHILYTYCTCTRRMEVACEHRPRSFAITSPMRYRYDNFVRKTNSECSQHKWANHTMAIISIFYDQRQFYVCVFTT